MSLPGIPSVTIDPSQQSSQIHSKMSEAASKNVVDAMAGRGRDIAAFRSDAIKFTQQPAAVVDPSLTKAADALQGRVANSAPTNLDAVVNDLTNSSSQAQQEAAFQSLGGQVGGAIDSSTFHQVLDNVLGAGG